VRLRLPGPQRLLKVQYEIWDDHEEKCGPQECEAGRRNPDSNYFKRNEEGDSISLGFPGGRNSKRGKERGGSGQTGSRLTAGVIYETTAKKMKKRGRSLGKGKKSTSTQKGLYLKREKSHWD